MLTRRQKNSIRGFTAVLSLCVLLSAFLIYTNISNAEQPERVVFSEILEGAVAYSDDDDEVPAVTLASEALMETMFSEKYATFTLPDAPPAALSAVDTTTTTGSFSPYGIINNGHSGTEDDVWDQSGIPVNPNEITLLSDELDAFRTEHSDDTTTSAVTTTYITAASSSGSSTQDTVQGDLTTKRTDNSIISQDTTASTTTARTATTTKATTVTTTKAKTTATAAGTAARTTSRPPITNIGGGTFENDDTIYLTMLKLVNDARREAGVKELWYSARVHDVCRIRADELTSYYSHNRPDGSRFSTAFKEAGITYEKCGENIAYGRNMFDTPEEVFK
ncbi:MAG: CAP domain-containing protein, partial [Ruminiclostridium sp.]|nr:CAP domain-containing protein [Ruminiclostridium sp.]